MSQQTISRYLIYSELDRGGMAIVYHGHDPNFDRDVAIKVLPRQFLHDRTFRARFQREAQSVAMLEHAAIVPVYDFGEEQGQMYLVMRYMTGGSLAVPVAEGPMSLADVAHIVSRLAPALDKTHNLGIIHRDLKPANILFDGDGEAYITDFGIARLVETAVELTASNVIVGTPAYMSPEQARDSSGIDGRSDIYSLGVIVFQALTARLPFQAKSSVGYLTAHVTDPVPNVLNFNPNLPPICRIIIERAMAKDPAERYQLTSELAADLKLATETISSADTLRASLHEADMSTVSRGATRRAPVPLYPPDPIKPPEISRPKPIRRAPHRQNVLWAWLAGSAVAAVLVCLILAALGMFDIYPMGMKATRIPPFPAIEMRTKVPTQTPSLPTVTSTATFTVMSTATNTSTATRIPALVVPTATSTLTPSPSPTTTAIPLPGSEHGLTDISFSLHKTYIAADAEIWFYFALKNNNSYSFNYGVLGAEIYDADGTAVFVYPSFEDGILAPGQVLNQVDNFEISTPGIYGVKLIICYDKLIVCNTPAGKWERLSPVTAFVVYVGNTPTVTTTPTVTVTPP